MPRPYHSPSSIKLAQRCEYAWALCYIEGLRTPGTAATALGTDGHTVLEDWYEGRAPAWDSFPGQVMHSGVHLLPHPDAVEWLAVERAIGDTPIDNPDKDGPQRVREIDGVRWAGFKDSIACPSRVECDRLGLPYGPVLLFDYKTSANIGLYALTEAELLADVQANLYGYDTCVEFDQIETPARWVYFETKRVRRAKAVDVTIHRDAALEVIAPCNARARDLDTLTDLKAATKNPRACGDYGGCKYHVSRGGPCDARRSIGALVQARVPKKEQTMAIDRSKFEALKNKANAAAATAEAEPETDAPAEGEADAPAAAEPDATKPAPAKPGPKPGPKPTAPAAGAKPSKLAALVTKLEAKEAECAEIKAEIKAVLG
jgi:hypothetical protein